MTLYATLPDLYEVVNKAADRIKCDDLVAAMQQKLFTDDEINTIDKYARDVIRLGVDKLQQDDPFAGAFTQRVMFHSTYTERAAMASNFTGNGLEVRMNIFYNPFLLCYRQGIRSLGPSFIRTDKNGKVRELKPGEPNDYYNMAAIILHECLHLINDHQHEFEFLDKRGYSELTNIACDGAINQVDYIANNSVLADYGVTFERLQMMVGNKVKLKPKDTAMNYFKAIYQAKQDDIKAMNDFLQGLGDAQSDCQSQQQDNNSQSSQQNSGSQSEQPKDDNNSKNGSSQNNNQQNKQQNGNNNQSSNSKSNADKQSDAYKAGYKVGKNGLNPNNSHSAWKNKPNDVDDIKNDTSLTADDVASALIPAIQSAMNKSNTDANTLKNRGLISAHLADKLIAGEATNEHRIPLRSIIMRGAGRLKFQKKRTYSRINHQQSNRIDIRRGYRKLNNKNLHVFVDCSGSMSDDDISWALKEIAYVAKRIEAEITIIPFDTDVYPDKAQKIDRHGNYEFEPIGRGGTVVQPCFDYLHDIGATSNNSDLAIILTDGGVESHVDTYGLRNIVWILVNSNEDTLDIEDKEGYVAYLDQDQDYLLHKMSER